MPTRRNGPFEIDSLSAPISSSLEGAADAVYFIDGQDGEGVAPGHPGNG